MDLSRRHMLKLGGAALAGTAVPPSRARAPNMLGDALRDVLDPRLRGATR